MTIYDDMFNKMSTISITLSILIHIINIEYNTQYANTTTNFVSMHNICVYPVNY